MIYSAIVSSVLGMLMGTGQIVSWILTRHRITQQLAEALMGITTDPTMFMAIVAISLLILGMIIDETALIVALAPLLAPIAARYGIDGIQFGVVFVMCCLIGLIMPPIALILFMTSSIAKISLESISIAIMPFVAWTLVVLALLVAFPPLTLWLPRLVGF
jgi:TRAP-type C4-dicarboxylate transport system permease large subunit